MPRHSTIEPASASEAALRLSGVSVGAKFDGDPSLWRIVDGKLYLNLNREIQKKWQEDIPGNIKKAEGNWQRIAGKTPQELS